MPERFNSSPYLVEQNESVSADGTKIPYFVVRSKTLVNNSANPTLLSAYGGFELPMTPSYLGEIGKLWLEQGGTYVLANIRGGGEFGPKWHQSVVKENRAKVFEDFISVAEDLIQRAYTSPKRLGIQGGSNGGLLVGGAFVQRPDLFNAVLCEVPLLDMIRYTVMKYGDKPAAGASWIDEYGDPADPKMREIILKWSPYQNVRVDRNYPRVFFQSSNDDRVHPGHARKMVARLEELGYPTLFFEDSAGGHTGDDTLENASLDSATRLVYLYRQLMDSPSSN